MTPKWLIITCVILFLACGTFGLFLAHSRPLWNDEIYSLVSSVGRMSYLDMIQGKIGEGNAYPLFYAFQKILCDVTSYEIPALWREGSWGYEHPYSQVFLRINPVVFMSLSIVVVFYYFSRHYSLARGLLSLFLSFSSYMIWVYWTEARPYALWVFLTTAQLILFLKLIQNQGSRRLNWIFLTVVHFLLSLTVVFSIPQIIIISLLLWILVEKRWRQYIFFAIIPLVIAGFYYWQSPKYQFCFGLTPEQLIRDCMSRDRFYILFIYIFFLGVFFCQKTINFPRLFKDDMILKDRPILFLTAWMLAAAFLVLVIFKIYDTHGTAGFAVTSRYFIYLTPLGIIATTILSVDVIKSLSGNRWIQFLVTIGISYLLIHRFIKTIPDIRNLCVGLFS